MMVFELDDYQDSAVGQKLMAKRLSLPDLKAFRLKLARLTRQARALDRNIAASGKELDKAKRRRQS